MTGEREPGADTADLEILGAETPAVASRLSDEQRIAAMNRELEAGFEALRGIAPAVSIFGSARTPATAPAYLMARRTAQQLGAAGFNIITGGGPGIMEAANAGAEDAGVHSVGLNIELPFEQGTNPHVTLSLRYHYFFTRKLTFIRYSCAFVVLPGGFGTMDELFEALTLIETGKIPHFPVVLLGVDYWSGLAEWIRAQMLSSGNIGPVDADLLRLTDDPAEVVAIVTAAARQQGYSV